MKLNRNLMLLAISCAFAGVATAGAVRESSDSLYKPTGKGWGELDIDTQSHPQKAATLKAQRRRSDLSYQGGPVMVGANNVYYIWYGSWDGASQNVLNNLASHIGGSPYFNINTNYYNGSGTHVQNVVSLMGSTTDSCSLGTQLTDANIESIVATAITSGALPSDANGVYMVLTDKNTRATSGFCTQYCGWHTPLRLPARTSSTPSSAIRKRNARPVAASTIPPSTAPQAPTRWPASSPTSWKRRSPTPT